MSRKTGQLDQCFTKDDRLPCSRIGGERERCWLLEHVAELASGGEKVTDQLLSACWTCPTFAEIKARAMGERAADRVVLELLDGLLREARGIKRGSWERVHVLEEISTHLEQQGDLDETLRLILTGITAGESLGFNRAFLFLVDEQTQTLRGQMAVGPADAEEAVRVWRWIAEQDLTLKEMMQSRIDSGSRGDRVLTERVRSVEIPLADAQSVLAKAVREQTTLHVTDRPEGDLFPALVDATDFVVIPLLSRGQAVGAILADNRYSHHLITDRDIHTLEAVACLASVAIQNHRLSVELQRKIAELEQAYNDVRAHQARLIEFERMAAVGQVTGMIAHEIKNPLVCIGGLARFMKKGIPSDHPHSKVLGTIISEITRLETLVQDIMDFSHARELHLRPVCLNEIVEQSITLMSRQLDESSIQTEVTLDEDVPAVHLDRDRMHQVLVNLFQNAIHAMTEGGTLSVYTRRREALVELEVADTGTGVPEEILDRLFDPFFTTKPRGSGLGLTICKRIVEGHNGHIEVVSRNLGASFVVRLPI